MVYPQADTQAVLGAMAAMDGPKLREVPAEQSRQMFRQMVQMLEKPAPAVARIDDLAVPGPHGQIPVRFYAAAACDMAGPLIVYFHGGGWVFGDLETHNSFCADLAAASGLRVLAVDYRMAPEHRFPVAHDECEAVVRWAAGSPSVLGGPVAVIGVAGDSAGGNLAAATALALRDDPSVDVRAQWLIYPVTDMAHQSASYDENAEGYLLERADMVYFRDAYAPSASDWPDWRLSPLLVDDLSRLPSAVVMTCELDPLRDEGRAYAGRLISAGVPVCFIEAQGQIHGVVTLRQAIASAEGPLSRARAAFIAQLRA